MTQNECYVDGKKYIAVANDDIEAPCRMCAGKNDHVLCGKLGLCTAHVRPDKRNINWYERKSE